MRNIKIDIQREYARMAYMVYAQVGGEWAHGRRADYLS